VHIDYELGRLLANQGKVDVAKKEFELVISGTYMILDLDAVFVTDVWLCLVLQVSI
jgi:hypothetical protein